MKEAALKHAKIALERARRALQRLAAANDAADAEEAWDHLLGAVSRVYEKLRAGASGDPPSWKWFRSVQDERRDDQLLCYIHHARNSDHHRFDEVVERVPGGIAIGAVNGGIHLRNLTIGPNGEIEAEWSPENPGAEMTFTVMASRLNAVDVTDRGVLFPVPTSHLGQPLADRAVLTIGRLAIDYAETLISSAESLRR